MTNKSLSLPSKATWILSGTQDNIICLPKPLHIVGFLLILWNISKSTGQIAIKFSRDIHVPPLSRYHDLAVSNKHALCMSCVHVGDWKGMAVHQFHSSTWQHRHRPSVASTSLQFLADRKLRKSCQNRWQKANISFSLLHCGKQQATVLLLNTHSDPEDTTLSGCIIGQIIM